MAEGLGFTPRDQHAINTAMSKHRRPTAYFYRFQQLLILIAHLLLLAWILYTLSEAGTLTTTEVLLHFLGMSVFGAILIRGTAAWARYHYIKSVKQKKHGH